MRRTLIFLAASILILALSAANFSRLSDKGYRQDEAFILNLVASGDSFAELITPISTSVTMPGFFLVFSTWVNLFGQLEPVVRLLPMLLCALTMSLIFRIASDLFDYRTGLIALFVLGVWPMFQAYGYEARPYPILMLCVAGTTWAFLRWMRHQRGIYAILYVAFGVVMVNTHLYGNYVPLGHAAAFVLLIPWNPRRYLKAAGLFAAVYFSFAASSLIVLQARLIHAGGSEGMDALLPSTMQSVEILEGYLPIRPVALGLFLLASALFIPLGKSFAQRVSTGVRWKTWKKWSLLIPVITIMLVIWMVNFFILHLSPRYLTILIPGLALIVTFTLRHLPVGAASIALLIFASQAFTPHLEVAIAGGRYDEMAATISTEYRSNSRFVIDAGLGWPFWGYNYYLLHRLPEPIAAGRLFFVTGDIAASGPNNIYPYPQHLIKSLTPATQLHFDSFTNDIEQLWYVRDDGFHTSYGDELEASLQDRFILFRAYDLSTFRDNWGNLIHEYRRIPQDLEPLYQFGDDLTLMQWHLEDIQAQPCQNLEIQSWWRTEAVLPVDYSAGIYLVRDGVAVVSTQGQLSSVQTQLWEVAEFYLDERDVAIPCDLPPGQYDVLLGVYDSAQTPVEDLPVMTSSDQPLGTQLYLTTIHVSAGQRTGR